MFMKDLFAIQNESGQTGSISLKGEEFAFSLGSKNVRSKASYVTAVSLVGNLPLSKVKASVTFMSLMGDSQTVDFIINENDFRALKQNLKK